MIVMGLKLSIWHFEKLRLFTRARDRTNVMCARSVLLILVVCKSTCVRTRTRDRMNVMCAIKLFINLSFEKPQAYSHGRETVRM